jgi:transposase, IS5 family
LTRVFTARVTKKISLKNWIKSFCREKGRLSAESKAIEHAEDFLQTRRRHSAVESAINALENNGLDRCPDHGLYGFKRYVSLAVLARNIQILGAKVQRKEQESLHREKEAALKRPRLAA